jgi:two-component system, chemotaxis family, chemotaxis protein CheY
MARIMLVDDTLMMRVTLKKILEEAGHTVVGEVLNGEEAVLLYPKVKPDLITMDITMPKMNGLEALEFIIKKYPEARVVMITALSQKTKVLTALTLGAKHYIIKPFDKRVVIEIIDKVLKEDGYEQKEGDTEGVLENAKKQDTILEEMHRKNRAEGILEFIIQNREGTYVLLPGEAKGQWLSVIVDKIVAQKNPRMVVNLLTVDTLSTFMFEQLARSVEKIKRVGGKIEIYAKEDVLGVFEGKPGYKMLMREVNKYF